MSRIFLIGMPGSGKSFWAKKIAEAHRLPVIDMDDYIEQTQNATITALFEQYGEAGFREIEAAALREIIAMPTEDVIIATGGGTPHYAGNLDIMLAAGTVVYLNAAIETLATRLTDEINKRPLLNDVADISSFLQQLLVKRREVYEKAHNILKVESLTLTTFDKIILTCINRH